MGRKKIDIKTIKDEKLKHVTFNKRKMGLLRKAAELCILCDIQMILRFQDLNGKIVQFSSTTLRESIKEKTNYFLTEKSYPNFFDEKESVVKAKEISSEIKELEENMTKKVKRENQPPSFFEFETQMKRNSIDKNIFEFSEFLNQDFSANGNVGIPYSLRSSNSRRHTLSFEFPNSSNYLFVGEKEDSPKKEKVSTPRSRRVSMELNKLL